MFSRYIGAQGFVVPYIKNNDIDICRSIKSRHVSARTGGKTHLLIDSANLFAHEQVIFKRTKTPAIMLSISIAGYRFSCSARCGHMIKKKYSSVALTN